MHHLAWLEAMVREPEAVGTDASAVRALETALAAGSEFPAPPDLLAAPSSRSAVEVHLRGLQEALAGADEVSRERARFHAAWLLHLLAPEDRERLPLVTVVIPVYNAAHLVAGAVASALAQTWSRLEVVVVDDGSTDDPARALDEVGGAGRVRVVRQENRGAAGARNRGIAEARGVFVHFLDADDVLDPDAVERKVAAFRAVPEAELCCSGYRAEGVAELEAGAPRGTRLGDALCPTRDLLATWVRRYPFQTSTVLVPRWVLLDTGPWDEDFSVPHSDASDALYWFRLGLRDTRVVAIDAALGTRRFREGSLTTHETALGPILFMTVLIELLDRPTRWPYVGPLLVRIQGRDRWAWIDGSDHPRLESLRDALLERVRSLGSGPLAGLSGRLPLLLLRVHVPAVREGEPGDYRRRLAAGLDRALATAPAAGDADRHLWLGAADGSDAPEENAVVVTDLRGRPGRIARWRRGAARLLESLR